MNSVATAGRILSLFLFVMITKIEKVTSLNMFLNNLFKMANFV